MSSFIDNLKFYLNFTFTLITTVPRNALTFLFYTVVHQLLGVDPAPKLAVERAFKKDAKPCPYARALGSHEYIPPAPGTRGPCPALNVMANHGYLPRDGQNISGFDLTRALMECYELSWPLAAFLSWGGVLMLGQVGLLSLSDLARHNRIEHDASITHANAPKGYLYAPTQQDPTLQDLFRRDEQDGHYTKTEIARARIRREAEPGMEVTAVQQEVARGEVALVLQIFGGEKFAVPKEDLYSWWFEERLPEGWKPTRQTTLLGTIHWSTEIRNEMNAMRDSHRDAKPEATSTNIPSMNGHIEEAAITQVTETSLSAKSAPQSAKWRRQLPIPAP